MRSCILRSGFPSGSVGDESACSTGDPGSIPGPGRSPEEWNGYTPVFLPGKSQGQRSLAEYSSCGHRRIRHDLATKPPPSYQVPSAKTETQ